ncbi:hypothetical protein HF313_27045 [Massilia atriviolacea]|uniref:Uncharacterized protein n=1 Tax=Massilia atriviolacea TaxID=2495579 RepID=A0A430HJ90_9BURK|nr:hypothetical protein [Massilia atriviolacea]RSZ57570.1 hypothetical protein EJB06_17895 [Massilia atriviolacea]
MTTAATQLDNADFLESAADNLPDNPLAQSALETTRDAIARWTGGIHLPRMLVPGMVRVSPQARWYAQANHGFQEWLNQGGFQGADGDVAADTGARADCTGQRVLDVVSPQQMADRLRAVDAENSDFCVD